MKIATPRQAMLVHMPPTDLGILCFLPEMHLFLAQFPGQVKVNITSTSCFLAVSRPVVPFLLKLSSDSVVLANVQRSLQEFIAQTPTG